MFSIYHQKWEKHLQYIVWIIQDLSAYEGSKLNLAILRCFQLNVCSPMFCYNNKEILNRLAFPWVEWKYNILYIKYWWRILKLPGMTTYLCISLCKYSFSLCSSSQLAFLTFSSSSAGPLSRRSALHCCFTRHVESVNNGQKFTTRRTAVYLCCALPTTPPQKSAFKSNFCYSHRLQQ